MTKSQAFGIAKNQFPGLKPTRASGFSASDDGKALIIPCHDEPVSVVFYHPTDIHRLMMMCKLSLMYVEDSKQ
jgi:hypothetical protein